MEICNGNIKGTATNRASELLRKPRAEIPALDRIQVERPPQSHDDVGGEGDRDKDAARVRKQLGSQDGMTSRRGWLESVVRDTSDRIGIMKVLIRGRNADKGGTVADE